MCENRVHEIARVDGEQGDEWSQLNVSLPVSTRPHQLVIKGVRGDGNLGDIGVDDIQYYDGPCESKKHCCGFYSFELYCTSSRHVHT